MEFREITIADKNWITRLRDTTKYPLTTYAFPALYTWRQRMGLTIAGNEEFYVVHSDSLDGYFYPCGQEEACAECVKQLIDRNNLLKLFYIGEAQKEQASGLGIRLSEDRNCAEYIYEWSTFAHPTQGNGHCIHDKVRKFSKNTDYTVRRITSADKELLEQITREWEFKTKKEADTSAVLEAVNRLEELELEGVILETADGQAFTLGYQNTPDIYTFSIVKFTSGLSADVIAVSAHELAKTLEGRGSYIDLEEDLGNEGMRRMKTAYHPKRLEMSYKGVYQA